VLEPQILQQKLRSLSHPLQRWQYDLGAFEDETPLECAVVRKIIVAFSPLQMM
jgi:hypothetical protein